MPVLSTALVERVDALHLKIIIFLSLLICPVDLLQKETGIDMNYYELYKLIEGLDKNKDGEINYR